MCILRIQDFSHIQGYRKTTISLCKETFYLRIIKVGHIKETFYLRIIKVGHII